MCFILLQSILRSYIFDTVSILDQLIHLYEQGIFFKLKNFLSFIIIKLEDQLVAFNFNCNLDFIVWAWDSLATGCCYITFELLGHQSWVGQQVLHHKGGDHIFIIIVRFTSFLKNYYFFFNFILIFYFYFIIVIIAVN